MIDGSLEEDFWRCVRVVGGIGECEFEGQLLVWCRYWARERCVPLRHVGVGWEGGDAWSWRHH